jgi:hypothetical protein
VASAQKGAWSKHMSDQDSKGKNEDEATESTVSGKPGTTPNTPPLPGSEADPAGIDNQTDTGTVEDHR